MRELEPQIGAVRVPCGCHAGTRRRRRSERPDRVQRPAGGRVDLPAELLALVEATRVEVGNRADHRGVPPVDVGRSGGDERLPLPRIALPSEDPADRGRRSPSEVLVGLPELAAFRGADPLRQAGRLVQAGHAPEVVPEVRLVLVPEVFRAPSAVQQPVLIPVVPDPPCPVDDVGPERACAEGRGRALDPVQATERPQRLPVAVPLPVVLLVLGTEEPVQRDLVEALEAGVEDRRVVAAELAVGESRVTGEGRRDALDG